ncbi:hypothetical protein R6Q59_034498 [Mikania micrantha]|uniref:Uncharacterized protein n=1 Tax=Mikania micrantha TaxID=192012 RepID=A0A5N6NJU2_9ASTR|nr:hypothetical protein E3N88_20570 [Mikania micrantha]
MAEQRSHDDEAVVGLIKADAGETFDRGVEDLENTVGDSLLINPDQRGSEVEDHKDLKAVEWAIFESSDKFDEDLDFKWDTSRLSYFNVTAFNLQGHDNINGLSTYDGGGMSGQVIDISLNNVISVSNSNNDGDGSQLTPLQKLVETVNGDGDEVVEKLEQERDGGEVVVQEKLIGGFVVIRWWKKWWLLLDLWKLL